MFKTEVIGENGNVLSRFKRSSSGNTTNNSNFRPVITDKIVEVVSVEPANNGEGKMLVKEIDRNGVANDDVLYEIMVKDSTYQLQKDKKPSQENMLKMQGWIIDERLKNLVAKKKHLVLTQTEYDLSRGKEKVVDGVTIKPYLTTWMFPVEDYSHDKLFRGLITVKAWKPYFDKHIREAQVWNPEAIAINNSDESNEKLGEFLEKLNEIKEKFEQNKRLRDDGVESSELSYPVRKGFALRTLKFMPREVYNYETKQNEIKTVPVVVDTYEPLVRTLAMQDPNTGEVEIKSEALNSEWVEDFLIKYCLEYAYKTFTDESPDSYNLEEMKLPKDVLVELLTFDDYLCNENDRLILNDPDRKYKYQTPLQRMATKATKPAADAMPENYYEGMNLAVDGIVSLSKNKLVGSSVVFRNNVNKLYLSGSRKRNINEFIPCSITNEKVYIDDSLRTEEEKERFNKFNGKETDDSTVPEVEEYISEEQLI